MYQCELPSYPGNPFIRSKPAVSEFMLRNSLRLSNGERILYGRFPNRERATDQGRLLSFKMGQSSEWPLIGGRFVRPESVVSVDVERLDDEG